MHKYIISVPEIHITELYIEANSRKEALDQAEVMIDNYGGYEMDEPVFSHFADVKEWKVRKQ
jgi:hypothetical protein